LKKLAKKALSFVPGTSAKRQRVIGKAKKRETQRTAKATKIAGKKKEKSDYKAAKGYLKTKKKTGVFGAEYDPTVTESTNGQEQLKGLKETILDMWKEAADTHVDPKEREELDKAPEDTAKKMKRAAEPKPMVATEALTAKQKKLDVDGDGEIEGSDLAKLRKKGAKKEDAEVKEGGMKRGKDLKTFKPKPKKEEVDEELTIPQVQEFKVASMKHALAKVWGLDEGELPPALKKAIDAKKKDGDEDEDKEESVKKSGKTETGKKKAEIEIDPELKEKNKK